MTEGLVNSEVALRRLAAELSDLEATGLGVEAAISRVGAETQIDMPLELQEVDRMVQRLRDMARCASVLAGQLPSDQVNLDDLLQAMRLERSKAALAGREGPPDESGESFFF